jgi:hypothetical protein
MTATSTPRLGHARVRGAGPGDEAPRGVARLMKRTRRALCAAMVYYVNW